MSGRLVVGVDGGGTRTRAVILDEAGEELWDALPIWSLGVKYVWEKVPLTPEEQVKRRFEEYLKKDAAPILKKHAPAALKLAGEVLRESLEDKRSWVANRIQTTHRCKPGMTLTSL